MKITRNQFLLSSQLLVGLWNMVVEYDNSRLFDKDGKRKPLKDFKLRYFLTKNLKAMGDELDLINKTGYEEYEKARIDLVKQHGKKDDKGELVLTDNGNATILDMKEFGNKLEELRMSYEGLFKFLEEEIDFEPHQIKLDDIPLDMFPLGPQDMLVLEPFIKEN